VYLALVRRGGHPRRRDAEVDRFAVESIRIPDARGSSHRSRVDHPGGTEDECLVEQRIRPGALPGRSPYPGETL